MLDLFAELSVSITLLEESIESWIHAFEKLRHVIESEDKARDIRLLAEKTDVDEHVSEAQVFIVNALV